MLAKVFEAIGFKIPSLTGPLTWLVGITMIFGGAATWLREDAIADTNAKWEIKASQAALIAHNAVAEKQLEIERLTKKLVEKENADVEKAKLDIESLAKQSEEFPLSEECRKCSIPNERIWLRRNQDMAGKSSKPISKPGS